MARPLRYLVVAVVVTAVLVAVGLVVLGGRGGGQDDTASAHRSTPSRAPAFTTTPLSAYDASGVVVRRSAFCDRVDPRQVSAALGGAPATHRSWTAGEKTRLAAGLTDVADEFGCQYTGAAGTTAKAWVFAPPVRRSTAARLAKRNDGGPGCTTTGSTYGSPSSLLTCQSGQLRTATYRGLFGDAWLSCELEVPLSVPASALQDRAGRWCVGVARAASG